VLIVDQDAKAAAALRELIAALSCTSALARSLREARAQMALQPPELVLLDMQLPDGSGLELFADPQLVADSEVVLMTGQVSVDASVQALRLGAADCLVKPIHRRHLQGLLARLARPPQRQAAADGRNEELDARGHFGQLWGRSAPMCRVYEQIARVAATGITVFVTGESGSGKEVVAQTVHEMSRRRKQPFLAVNCGAISPQLIESEVFGHEKGSFTGAERQHLGFFERANGGTLFLDEITEMPPELQVKLLRVLETGRFMRVGSTDSQAADGRVIAATNRAPQQAVASGRLREDLFYRLNVFPIHLPPLRERADDVPLLAEHFVRAIGAREGHARRFTPAALAQLQRHTWPGNVRELRNAVQRAYVMATGAWIDDPCLAADSAAAVPQGRITVEGGAVTLPVGWSMAQAERQLILATFAHCERHKERTAAMLGISLKTLYNRLKEYRADPAQPSLAAAE